MARQVNLASAIKIAVIAAGLSGIVCSEIGLRVGRSAVPRTIIEQIAAPEHLVNRYLLDAALERAQREETDL